MKYKPVALVFILTFAASAFAQWSSDPTKNLPLADRGNGNDQVQPKVRPLPNNGWYVSWFDANPNSPPPIGYDVYLQRLNPNGVEQFRHDGIKIADLGNSSTEDYGLDADTQGNALLAFLDDRESDNQQITATRVSPSGKQLWGKLGVQLTNDENSHAAPKIAGASDGGIIVAWTSNTDVVLQKLNAAGKPQWGKGVVLSESNYSYLLADLHSADDGSVIVSWVRNQGFGSDNYLYANKLSSKGKLLWGKSHVKVYDGGSLQFGEFPYFVTDGKGGAVFSWYTSSPALQVYAQHILASGKEAFPHNGSVGSTDKTRVRVSPSASYRAATGEVFMFWTEEDSTQTDTGVYGQKFNSKGKRDWTQTGLVLIDLGVDQQIWVENVQIGSGALVFWVDQASFGSATMQATRLKGTGAVQCAQFGVSTTPADKYRLSLDLAHSGLAAVAWEDDRNGNNDIYIQNVNKDCTLGIEN